MSAQPLLYIDDLSIQFKTPEGIGHAVEGLRLGLQKGETLGLVGESGCGKSVTALGVMGLIETPPAYISSGRIVFDDRNLLALKADSMRRIRGRDMAMIFQEPMTSLNPVLTIGRQVAEPLMLHNGLGRAEAYKEALVWLDYVKIPAARRRLRDYPHQLSGGMRQRVMIAMAMVCHPRLLIADEPTTALDVSIQSQILSLMQGLKRDFGMALLLITHDLGVVAQMADRVVVMYAGQVVESAATDTIFSRPFHPYTQGLLRSIPRLGRRSKRSRQRLIEIPGTVPALTEHVRGCKFAGRCPSVFEPCQKKRPDLAAIDSAHSARCWLAAHPKAETIA